MKILAAILLAVTLSCSTSTPTPPVQVSAIPKYQPEQIKGWIVVGISASGSCAYRPFVKTGIADDDDMGNGRIEGYTPGNVQKDSKGRWIPERPLEALFVGINQAKTIGGRMCIAPSW